MKRETVQGFLVGVILGGLGVGVVMWDRTEEGGVGLAGAGVSEEAVVPREVVAEAQEATRIEDSAGEGGAVLGSGVQALSGIMGGKLSVDGKEIDMQAMMLEGMKRQWMADVGAKVLGLKQAVGLRGGQEEVIRKYLQESGEAEAVQMMEAISGQKGDGVAVAAAMMKGPKEKQEAYEAFVNGVLDAGQREAFATHLEQQKGERIDAVATSELARLQTTVRLTEEQKEAAYAIFAEDAADMDAGGMATGGGVVFLGNQGKKRGKLAEVLSEEQMEVYEQSGGIFPFGGGAGVNGFEVIGTSAISIGLGNAEEIVLEPGEAGGGEK